MGGKGGKSSKSGRGVHSFRLRGTGTRDEPAIGTASRYLREGEKQRMWVAVRAVSLVQPEPLGRWFADALGVGPRGTTTRIAGAGIWIREKKLRDPDVFVMLSGLSRKRCDASLKGALKTADTRTI